MRVVNRQEREVRQVKMKVKRYGFHFRGEPGDLGGFLFVEDSPERSPLTPEKEICYDAD